VNEPPPPLSSKVPGLSRKVEDVLLRALAKRKQDRFASIGDFATALEAAVLSAARTVQLPEPAADAGPAGKPTLPTTFTQTAGEMDDAVGLARARLRAWIWAAAGAAAILVISAFLVIRSGPAPKLEATSSPLAAPVAAPPPTPVRLPVPPAPTMVETDHESPKPDPPSPSTHGRQDKGRLRAAAPAPPEPKRTRPVRRRPVPRMIEDL
jgi:eukaryotic-like serine/threonine-protein kinase